METKRCGKCGETKPQDSFSAHKSMKDGKQNNCKDCRHEMQKAYRNAHPDRAREINQKYQSNHRAEYRERYVRWKRNNRDRALDLAAVHRARQVTGRRDIEPVDRATIIARDNSTCYLCGVVLEPRSVCLDHVVPLSRGGPHTAENLRVTCRKCNERKHDKLLSELDWYKP